MLKSVPRVAVLLVATLAATLRATLSAADPDEEPWLEFRHLSEEPKQGYKPVSAEDGATLYSAEAAIVDPIGFADVTPAEDGTGITISLTKAARKRLLQFTKDHVGEMAGFFLNGEMILGPIHIAEAIGGNPHLNGLPPGVGMSLVKAWSAPADASEGRRRLRIAGLGVIEVEIRERSGDAVVFLHQGSLYRIPISFLSRPELPEPQTEALWVSVTREAIRHDGLDLGTPIDALRYIRNTASEERLIILDCSKQEMDQIPEDEMKELTPLFAYSYDPGNFVGLRQRMAEDWKWPARQE